MGWACHLRAEHHIGAVEAGVDPLEVLWRMQLELAVQLAAYDEELRRGVLNPYIHVGYHAQLKILRTLAAITIDTMILDRHRGRDPIPTASPPSTWDPGS